MCVPSASVGLLATAAWSSGADFVKSWRTVSSGPKTTTATGSLPFRTAMNLRAACMAPAIGLPFMLFDASMRRIAPLAVPGASTVRFETTLSFSKTATLSAVSARRSGRRRKNFLSGKLESGASWSAGAPDWPTAATGATRVTSTAPRTEIAAETIRARR